MESIPWYRSQVYVGALIVILTQASVLLGVSDHFSEADITKFVNAILEIVSFASSVWILIARHRSKIQPITLMKKEP